MLLGVPKSDWLVSVDGVNECISIMVRNSGKKNEYFPYLLAFLLGFLEIRVFLGWILVILWPKVMKNYGIPKIHVLLGWILAILWPKVTNNYGVSKICVFLGRILVILWPKVTNNYGVPEIRVFLHPENAQISCCG